MSRPSFQSSVSRPGELGPSLLWYFHFKVLAGWRHIDLLEFNSGVFWYVITRLYGIIMAGQHYQYLDGSTMARHHYHHLAKMIS